MARLQSAAAELVSPLLFAPQFVGVKPPERVAFDLVVDQVAITLHRASRDGLPELEAGEAARTRAEELAARVREVGLEGAPDMRRTASPPARGVEDVSSSVGGVGQREPVAVGDAASERGSADAYPGESQPGPSTVQATAHQGSAAGDVAASGQQDADAGTAKRVQSPAIDKERLKEWVVLAQQVGGAETVEAGLEWVHRQGFGVDTGAWGRRGVVMGFWITGLLILRMRGIHSRGRGLTVLVSGMSLTIWICCRWIGRGLPSRRVGRRSRWRGCSWLLRSW